MAKIDFGPCHLEPSSDHFIHAARLCKGISAAAVFTGALAAHSGSILHKAGILHRLAVITLLGPLWHK